MIGSENVVIEYEITEKVPVVTEIEETDTEVEEVQPPTEQPSSVFSRVWNYMFASKPAQVDAAPSPIKPKKKIV